MKKDIHPNIKIEILSEGLAKKILGKVEDAPPSVYGEEKPTSATIPDINAKGVNKDMAESLETSHKKPNYTGIIKEAMLELRKDSEKMPEETGKPDYQERTEFQEGYMLGDDYPRFGTKFTEEDGRTTQYRVFPDYSTLTNGDRNFSMGTASEYYQGDKPAPEGLATKRYNLPKDDVLSQSTYDPRTGIESTAGTYYGPGTSKYHAGTDTWMEEPGGVPRGFYQKITRPTSKDAPTGASTTEYARSLETKALVKEAVQELRKETTGSRQSFGDLTTGQMDRKTGTRPGTAFTRMTESGTDEYGSPDQFQVTPPPDADAGVQSTASKRRGIESQVASQTQNMVKEAIQELRKAPVDYGAATPGGKTRGVFTTPESAAGREEAKQSQASLATGEALKAGSGVAGAMSAGSEYLSSLKTGTGGVDGGRVGPGYKPAAYDSPSKDLKDYKPPAIVGADKDPGIDYASLGTRSTGEAKGGDIPGGSVLETDGPEMPKTSMPTLVGGPDVDEDVIEGRGSGTLPPDESTKKPEEGGPGTTEEVVVEEPSVEDVSGKVAANVTGIDPTIIDEIEKPVGQISSEITRPNNPTDSSKKLPQFGSSGYFSAVLQIGEGNTIERDGKQVPLSSVNYGVKNLAEFLELYPQNETFDKDKFLDTLTTEKSITKAQNPKSITAKPTANVNGVNVSSTVVSGAGTMKTLEKTGKGLNKPKASGTPRKTRAKKINPKNIQTKAVMKSERPAMDNTLSYIIKEAIEEIKLDKAALEKQKAPSTFSSKRQTYRG